MDDEDEDELDELDVVVAAVPVVTALKLTGVAAVEEAVPPEEDVRGRGRRRGDRGQARRTRRS